MKILVTGANGFIGSSIIDKFKTNGFETYGWDIYNKKNNVDCFDMMDSELIVQKLLQIRPDIIIHCAGSADVSNSINNPSEDFNGNVVLTHNLLFAAHKSNLFNTRFIFLSSAGVYGNPENLPIIEDSILKPMSPYALHKVMCEDICKYFYINYNLDIKIARIFSAYGAGLKKQIFWDMYQKFENIGLLEMFGTGYESRDYINIKDLINALFLITTKAPKKELIYNVANGIEITIRQATETFAKYANIPIDKILFNNVEKEGNPKNWKADITKLKLLGYKYDVDMDEGILNYIQWIKNR